MTDDLIKRDADRLRVFEKWLYTMDLAGMSEEQPNLTDIASTLEAQSAEIEKLKKAIKVQASAVRTLQANEETEINILRQQKREWHQAVSSLDSEREANAILTAENERLREALRTVEQGVPRPVGRSWFPDGRPSEHDQCIHGIWVYEPCEGCTDAFIAAALGETK